MNLNQNYSLFSLLDINRSSAFLKIKSFKLKRFVTNETIQNDIMPCVVCNCAILEGLRSPRGQRLFYSSLQAPHSHSTQQILNRKRWFRKGVPKKFWTLLWKWLPKYKNSQRYNSWYLFKKNQFSEVLHCYWIYSKLPFSP